MIGNSIRQLRQSKKLTLEELADILNTKYPGTVNFNKGKLSKWENGKEEPKLSSVRIIADYFGITIDEMYNNNLAPLTTIYNKLNTNRQSKVYTFAEEQLEEQNEEESYGNVVEFPNGRSTAAGNPIDGASEDGQLQSMLVMDRELIPDNADELITVAGDSMEPTLIEGQQVFIRYQPHVEQGEIAIVSIEDEGVTCKRVYFNDDDGEITLESDNDAYEDMVFLANHIRIIGKVLL